MPDYALSAEREDIIAKLAGVSLYLLRKCLYEDCLYYDFDDFVEHVSWLRTASDKEIAEWVSMVILEGE